MILSVNQDPPEQGQGIAFHGREEGFGMGGLEGILFLTGQGNGVEAESGRQMTLLV